jgi:predicted dehydrogenase
MISEFHLRGWQRTPEVEIVALVDPVRERAEGRRAQFALQARFCKIAARSIRGVPCYSSTGS